MCRGFRLTGAECLRAIPWEESKLSTTGIVVDRGLEGVVVGSTLLSNVEGKEGRLTFRGYDINDLAPNACFEEVVHLLLYGHLPSKRELAALKKELGAHRMIPEPLINAMERAPKDAWPMEVLRTIVSGLGLFSPVDPKGAHKSDVHVAIELVAKIPTIVAMWDRIRRGLEPVEPREIKSKVILRLRRVGVKLRRSLQGLQGRFIVAMLPVEGAEHRKFFGVSGIEKFIAGGSSLIERKAIKLLRALESRLVKLRVAP